MSTLDKCSQGHLARVSGIDGGPWQSRVQRRGMGRRRQPEPAWPGARRIRLARIDGSAQAVGEPTQKTTPTTPSGVAAFSGQAQASGMV